jgi:hypothetical protein
MRRELRATEAAEAEEAEAEKNSGKTASENKDDGDAQQ